MNTKHTPTFTPGPWETVGTTVRTPFRHGDPTAIGLEIAECCQHNPSRFADARLIAAAPDLLEVLRNLERVGMSIRADSIIWKDIRAAIAKAEGQ